MLGDDAAILGAWALAWLLGGLPSGVIAAAYAGGPDPRAGGSGNIGATNAFRVGGRNLGLLTLGADAGKGLLAVGAARLALDGTGPVAVAALLAVAGHCWSPYLGLRGGKGVAVGLGAWLALAPLQTLAAAGAWIAVVSVWRTSSLAALAAAGVLPLLVGLDPDTRKWLPATLALSGIVALRHRENLGRLKEGEEPRL